MLKRQKDREEENPRENETRPRRVAVLANDLVIRNWWRWWMYAIHVQNNLQKKFVDREKVKELLIKTTRKELAFYTIKFKIFFVYVV